MNAAFLLLLMGKLGGQPPIVDGPFRILSIQLSAPGGSRTELSQPFGAMQQSSPGAITLPPTQLV